MNPFTHYDPATHTGSAVVAALFGPTPGITVLPGSIQVTTGSHAEAGGRSLSFYDGSLAALGIGAGLLLTSGDASPPLSNTRTSYGRPLNPSATDASLTAVIEAAFPGAGAIRDATILQFQFNVADPALTNIRFDLVFGSDEFPEYSNTNFVDIAGVFVNGVNYALFNAQPNQPLSVLSQNLVAGNFRDNRTGHQPLPIEYDGVSGPLAIIAPLAQGANTLKIAIADTGDQAFDSGLFIANVRAVPYAGAGLAQEVSGTGGNDVVTGGNFNQVFDLGAGKDIVILVGSANDVVNGGGGADFVAYSGNIASFVLTPTGFGWTVTGPGGNDTLIEVERVFFDASGLFALDTQAGGNTWFVYALMQSLTNAAPSTALLSLWTAEADKVGNFDLLAQQLLDHYAPGLPLPTLVGHLLQTVVGVTPTADLVATFVGLVGPGQPFANAGALAAAAAAHPLNTVEIAAIVGKPLALDVAHFVA